MQANISLPLFDTVIASPSPLATDRNAGVEKTPKRSRLTSAIHELLPRNRSDVGSSRSTPPTLGAFMWAHSEPSGELVPSLQPDPTVTSPSSIGMSLETYVSC